jgi:hypothetical protein
LEEDSPNNTTLERARDLANAGRLSEARTACELKTVGYIEFENIITNAYDDIIDGANVASTLQSASANLKSAWAIYQSS